MDKLIEPSISIEEFYIELIENKRNNEKNNFLKNRLSKIKDVLISEEKNYIDLAKTSTLHTIVEHTEIQIPKSSDVVTKDEMESLYTQNLVSSPNSGDRGREVYDYLKSLALDKMCPYCSITKARTLDHYLPKAKFPTFAVTPVNLVPCCRDCNSEKDASFSNAANEMFIHPYYDDVNNFIWLVAIVEENVWPISFKYNVKISYNQNSLLSNRIAHQYELLDLNSTFSDKANRQFRYRLKSIVDNYNSGDIEAEKFSY
ncbi:HNH endonuclease [Neobacillus niacini]|uniref:HNH endonuclease n=1 Tax=Neobacillus niacini TaxID=86668 RepID=UPI0006948120|nr:HNH endonuclease signature motif containing protein [Neobacillus niacini]